MEAQINQIFNIIESAENREISKIAAETLANKCLDNPLTIFIIFKNFLDFSVKGKLRVFDDAGFLIDLILEELDKEAIKKLFETEFFRDCIKNVYKENKIFYSFDHINNSFTAIESIIHIPFEALEKISFETIEGLYSNRAEDWGNSAPDSDAKNEAFGKIDLEILFPIKDDIKLEIEQCMNVGKNTNVSNASTLNRQSSNLSANTKENKISICEFYKQVSKRFDLKINDEDLFNFNSYKTNNNSILKKKTDRNAQVIDINFNNFKTKDENIFFENPKQNTKSNTDLSNSDSYNNNNNRALKATISSQTSIVRKRKLDEDSEQKREKLEFYFNPLYFVVENFLKLNFNENWKARLCSISSLTLLSKFFNLFYYKFFKVSCSIITNVIKKDKNLNSNNKKARGFKKINKEKAENEEFSIEISIDDLKIIEPNNQNLNNLSLNNNNIDISYLSNNNSIDENINSSKSEYNKEEKFQDIFVNFERKLKENLFTSLFINSLIDKVIDFDSEDYICIFKDLNLKLSNNILDEMESVTFQLQDSSIIRDLNKSIYLLLNKAINAYKLNADWQPIFSILTFLKLKMTGNYKTKINKENHESADQSENIYTNNNNNFEFENHNYFDLNSASNINNKILYDYDYSKNNCNTSLFHNNSIFNISFSNKEYSIFSLIENLMKIDSEEIVNVTIQILDRLMEKFNKENYNSDHINISKDKSKIISIFKSFIVLINNYDDIEVGVKYYFNCLHNFIIFFKNLNEKNISLEDPKSKSIIENDLIFYALNKNKSVRIKYFNLINNILEGKLINFLNHREFIQKNVLLAIQGICLETNEEIVTTQKRFVFNLINSNEEACLDVFFNFSKFIIKLILKKNVKESKNFFIPNNEKFVLSEMEAFYSAFFVNDLQVDSIKINNERKLKHMIPIIANVMKKRIDFVSVLIKNLNLDFNDLKISKNLLIFLKIYYNYLELIDDISNKTLIVPNEILNLIIDNKKLDELPLYISKKDIDSGVGIALKFFLDFLEKYIKNYKSTLNNLGENKLMTNFNNNLNNNENQNFLMEEFNKVVFIYNNLINNRVLRMSLLDDLLKIIFNKIKDFENIYSQQQPNSNLNGTNGKNQSGNKIDLIYENFKIITNNLKKTDEDYLSLKIRIRAYSAISLFNHFLYSNMKFDKISIFINPILNCLKINSKEAKVFTKNLIIMVLNYTANIDSRNKIMNLLIDNCLNCYSDEIKNKSTKINAINTNSNNNLNNLNDEIAFILKNPKNLKLNYPLKYLFNFLSKSGKNIEMKKIFENFLSSGMEEVSNNNNISNSNEKNLNESKMDNFLLKIVYFLFNISQIKRDLNFVQFINLKNLIDMIIKEEKLINQQNIEEYIAFIIVNFSKLIDDEDPNFDNSLIIDQIFSYLAIQKTININSNDIDKTEKMISNKSIEFIFKILNIVTDSQQFQLICINYIFDVIKFINSKNESLRTSATNLFSKLMKIISYLKLDKSYETQIMNMKRSLKGLDNFSLIKNFVQQKDIKQSENNKSPQDEFELAIKIKENLRYYQITGIKWLCTLTSLGLGLALCDDMGLGKTIQTLCCIANETKLYQEKYGKSPISLIVCPNTLILNWIKESKKFFNDEEFKLKKFEGKFHRGNFINGNNNNNYTSCSSIKKNNNNTTNKITKNYKNDIIKINESEKDAKINKIIIKDEENYINKNNKYMSKAPIEVYVTSYDKIREMDEISEEFFYVVLDEAHIIKNPKTKLYQNIKKLSSERRIILTGTPIQNNVMELWSLFDFLMPGFLGTENDFEIKFHKKIYTNIKKLNLEEKLQENIFQSSLNEIRKRIKPFILRRLKQDVLKELPDKIIQDYICEMTQVQKDLYSYWDTVYSSVGVAKKDEKGKDSGKKHQSNNKKYVNKDSNLVKATCQPVLKIIDSMRKICNYPGLLLNTNNSNDSETKKTLEKYKDKINDFNCSGKLKALEDILVSFNFSSLNSEIINNASTNNNIVSIGLNGNNTNSNKLSENKILIFSQYKAMLQIIKNFLETNFKSLKVKILSSEMNEIVRSDIVNSFNSDPEINILLLTTSIGGLGLSLTAANIVIMYDHDWNPMRDLQAMDRAHRLGQKKTVEVFR